MLFVDTLEFEGLGNRSYLAGGPSAAVVVDPPRDVDQVVAAAARRGVRIAYVAETHVHNDYVTGGLELARLTGARYLVPAAAEVVAICRSGHRSQQAAELLTQRGIDAAHVTGGMHAWAAAGLPVVDEDGQDGRIA